MPILPEPYIPGKDPPIRRHASKYMLAPFGSTSSWGYAPLDDWARGSILGYVLGSLADWAGPSTGPTTVDDANDDSTGCFANDVIRDDDSL